MTWSDYFRENGVRIAETRALAASGAHWRMLQAAVRDAHLIRVRRGHYALPGTDVHTLEAVRIGGRLACVSALADLGVFALDPRFTHVHLGARASRLRAPHDASRRLDSGNRHGVTLHWRGLIEPDTVTEYRVGLADAVVQGFRCQEPRFALASLENALHLRLLAPNLVPEIFAALPQTLQHLRAQVDPRSEAGQETALRYTLEAAGYDVRIQVQIPGVGRVDMIVEGCVVVEADSRGHHDGWEAHARDRARDRELAAAGYATLRVLYQDIVHHPERVIAAVAGLLAAHRHFRAVIP